jgi:ribosome-associated protein
MISVVPGIQLDEGELSFHFILASGPGGQNVNKVATAVQLRFNVLRSRALPEAVRARLIKLAGKRMTKEGELVLTAKRFRTQERNRQDAVERLVALIRQAAEAPKPRRQTRPSQAAKQQRLKEKQQRGERKQLRRSVKFQDE